MLKGGGRWNDGASAGGSDVWPRVKRANSGRMPRGAIKPTKKTGRRASHRDQSGLFPCTFGTIRTTIAMTTAANAIQNHTRFCRKTLIGQGSISNSRFRGRTCVNPHCWRVTDYAEITS